MKIINRDAAHTKGILFYFDAIRAAFKSSDPM